MTIIEKVGELVRVTLLPHKSNNQRPKLLHPAGLSVVVAVFLLNFSLRPLVSKMPGLALGFSSSVSVEEVIAKTNEERQKTGLSSLVQNPLLSQAAYAKASDMMNLDYWSHVSPAGTQPWSFIKNTGYTYRFAGENLARDFSDTSSLINAWMDSPSHRDNILGSNYSDIGVAVVDGNLQGVETRLVVQMFATPISSPVAQAQPLEPLESVAQTQMPPEETAQEIELEQTPFLQEGSTKQELKPQYAGTAVVQRIGQPIGDKKIISPTEITQTFGIVLILLILGTLVVDWVIAHRRRSVRLVGKNWAHITYFTVMALILLQYAQGRIL